MAKNPLLPLLFSLFVANLTILNATNVDNVSPMLTDTCEAPPPDSFRIVDAGAHYVTLAWNPIDPIATYTIVVQKQGGNANTWENVDTISNVSGSSITIQNLLYGSKYQFELATNCGNGDPSKLKIYAGPPIGVILDLVLSGRTPLNPTSVPNCQPIAFENYNWVGFKVESTQTLGSDANFFEFGVGSDGVPQIKRVIYGPRIVATSDIGIYPEIPFPTKVSLEQSNFLIKRVDGLISQIIGKVHLFYDPLANPKTVSFCKDASTWSMGYKFTPMTASFANGFQMETGQMNTKLATTELFNIVFKNPVFEYLQVWIDREDDADDLEYSLQLFDVTGKLALDIKGEIQNNEIIVPTGDLPKGLYFCVLQKQGQFFTSKISKL
jgi:hypothetical protein